jgi:endogenous inhibitor of DNA gyrase (YacG/DUF329 family)
MKCPICEREFDPTGPTAAKPFCSERCKLVDLGRWLGEGYGLPAAPEVDPDEEAGSAEPES